MKPTGNETVNKDEMKMAKGNGNAAVNAAVESEGKTRNQKSYSLYVGTDGEGKEVEGFFPTASAHTVRIVFGNDVKVDLPVSELSSEITNCAVLQGITTRLQRSYQAEKDLDKCVEAVTETIADLKNGVWMEPKGGGPRVTILAQALIRVLEAKGEAVDDDRKRAIIEKLKIAEFADKAMANKAVASAVEDIKFENAKERRDAAKKAMKEAGAEELNFGV